MRRLKNGLLLLLINVVVFSACTKNNTDINVTENDSCNQNVNVEQVKEFNIDDVIENIPIDCFIENKDYQAVLKDDCIFISELTSNNTKKLMINNANNIQFWNDSLFYTDKDYSRIIRIDCVNSTSEIVYTAPDNNAVSSYYILPNGNLVIQNCVSKGITGEESEIIDSQIIHNFELNKTYAIDNDNGYYNGKYCVNNKSDDNGTISRIFYGNQYRDVDMIFNYTVFDGYLYYFHDLLYDENSPEKVSSPMYRFSIEDGEEFIKAFPLKKENNILLENPLELYSYRDKFYILLGINRNEEKEYEGYQFAEIDEKGGIIKRYDVLYDVDNDMFNFFNNKIYYYDKAKKTVCYFELD